MVFLHVWSSLLNLLLQPSDGNLPLESQSLNMKVGEQYSGVFGGMHIVRPRRIVTHELLHFFQSKSLINGLRRGNGSCGDSGCDFD